MSRKTIFQSVKEYLDAQPQNVRAKLLELKEYILIASPSATESINYNIPAYSLVENGRRDQQIMIAGYTNHVGFYPHPAVMAKFDSELVEYKRGKGSVQFPVESSLPKDLIIRMVLYRVKMLKK